MRRIAWNTGWLLLGRLLSQGLGLVFTILIAQYLGAAGLGQYMLIAAVIFVGNVVSTFGMDTLLIREVRRPDLPAAALHIELVLALAFIAITWLGSIAIPDPTLRTALRLYSLSLIPLAFSTLFNAVLRGRERMDRLLIVNLASMLVQVGGAMIILARGGGLIAIAALLIGAQVVAMTVGWVLTHEYLPTLRWPSRFPVDIVREGAPLAGLLIAAVIYQRIGVFSLSSLTGDTTTGWYGASARIVEGVKMVPGAYFGAVFPAMAAGGIPRRYEAAFLALIGFAAAALAGAYLLGGPLITLLYGADYGPSIAALAVLMWGLLPFILVTRLSVEMVTAGQEGRVLTAVIVALIAAVGLHIALIKAAGLLGACWATVISEVIHAGLLLGMKHHAVPQPA